MCERLLANPLIESYEVQAAPERGPLMARVGVVVFPGSCDEADALGAVEPHARAVEASSCGTATATCAASTRS